MAFWNRNVNKPTGPSNTPVPPAPPPPVPEIEQLAELIPERNRQEVYLWQPYVDRIIQRFDGLPAPEGGKPFVRACLAAGCEAVPVMEQNVMWKNKLPDRWDTRARDDFEVRVRLGLFFAVSLRYLAHTLCRLRIKMGRVEDWHVFRGHAAGRRSPLAAALRRRRVLPGTAGGVRRQDRHHLAGRPADACPGQHLGTLLSLSL